MLWIVTDWSTKWTEKKGAAPSVKFIQVFCVSDDVLETSFVFLSILVTPLNLINLRIDLFSYWKERKKNIQIVLYHFWWVFCADHFVLSSHLIKFIYGCDILFIFILAPLRIVVLRTLISAHNDYKFHIGGITMFLCFLFSFFI